MEAAALQGGGAKRRQLDQISDDLSGIGCGGSVTLIRLAAPFNKGVLLMSSAVMERRSGFATGAAPAYPANAPSTAPTPNVCVVPRCELKFEKCKGGFKISCRCENGAACQTLQSLCQA